MNPSYWLIPSVQEWQFDSWSAFIGGVVALALVGLAYALRRPLRRGWQVVGDELSRLRHRLSASVDARYRELVVTWADAQPMFSHLAPLHAIFVPPYLQPPLPHPRASTEDQPLAARSRSLPLARALGGHTRLALLGGPGTGRTTLLAYLAYVHARAEAGEVLGLSTERLPLCVHLPEMGWGEREQKRPGPEVDELVRAALQTVGGQKGLARWLQHEVEAGAALILADRWDELAPQEREQAAAWLSTLGYAYPGNFWIVVSGERGYAPLTDVGFVPVALAPWDEAQATALAGHWADVPVEDKAGRPTHVEGLDAALQEAAGRGANALELTLCAFVYLLRGSAPPPRSELFDAVLDLLLRDQQEKATWAPAVGRAVLARLALVAQQGTDLSVDREEIETAIEAALPPAEERPARAVSDVFRSLTGRGRLLVEQSHDRFRFVHPVWQAYLAARQLIGTGPAALSARLDDPRWAEALDFYAEMGQMGPLVEAWLREPDDLFRTRLLRAARWASVAPADADWRDTVMAALARAFLRPGQTPQVRVALAHALAATGARGVGYFFRQTAQRPDPELRAAALVGLGALAEEEDLPLLGQALEDPDLHVRQAAAEALGAMGSRAAVKRLEKILVEAEEDELRQAVARALAVCGEEGWEVLRASANDDDLLTRRAAVYGLVAVGRPWAREVLERLEREDTQWLVRSAASVALSSLAEEEKALVPPPLSVADQPWLIAWAAERRESVGTNEAAWEMLLRALAEGPVPVRQAAARTLVLVGRPEQMEPLRNALADPDPAVAKAALEALAEISRRHDWPVRMQ